ncbi:MAG: hypothetical protein M3Z62_13575, partial [Metasolibacillus sp.]|nr:hypothetical protein [Metasolibacillus sp.]
MTLYNTQSPITKDERVNINKTWDDILRRFNNLQRQINILAGDNDVDELIKRIQDALDSADSTLAELQAALNDASDLIDNMINATIEATEAATAANQATADATQIINDLTALQVDLEQLQTSLEQSIADATAATTNANTATTNANQATQDAQQATTDATSAAQRAESAADAVKGWGQAEPYNSTKTYERNNVVTYEGSSYQAKHDGVTSIPTTTADWIIIARRGLDGQGAVQTVNEQLPDEDGNVDIGIANINGLQVALDSKANDADLTLLDNKVTTHLDKNASLIEKGHVQLSNTPAMDETKAITPRGVAVVVGEFYNSGFNSASARIATDLNAINISSRYYTYNTTLNKPPNTLHGLVETIINDTQAVQIFYETHLNDRIYFRRKSEGVWKPWVSVVTSSMTWIEATPQNGWQQPPEEYMRLRYTKDSLGFVHVEGHLFGGAISINTIITTLPINYRPITVLPIN